MINPGISLDSIQELLSLVDYVLVMTVNPGFAGRDYLHFVEPKIEQLLKLRQRYKFDIVIDGGVTWEILERLWKKGWKALYWENRFYLKKMKIIVQSSKK